MSLRKETNYSGIGCDCSLAGNIGSSWSIDGKTIYSSNGNCVQNFQSDVEESTNLHPPRSNSLTESYGLCYNSGKSKEEDTEMSLVSLFTWKDGAILASDTRSTRRYGNGEVKYLDDFRKIHRLNDHLYFAITGTDSFYDGEDCFVFAEYILDQGPRSADGFCRAVGNLIFNSLTGFPANSIFLLYEFQKSMVSLHEYSVKGPSMDYKVRALHYDDKMQYSLFGEDYARQFVTDSPPSFYNVEDAIQKTVNLFDRVKEISALYPIPTVGGGTDIIYYDRYSDKIKKIRRDSKPL